MSDDLESEFKSISKDEMLIIKRINSLINVKEEFSSILNKDAIASGYIGTEQSSDEELYNDILEMIKIEFVKDVEKNLSRISETENFDIKSIQVEQLLKTMGLYSKLNHATLSIEIIQNSINKNKAKSLRSWLTDKAIRRFDERKRDDFQEF
ncbi:MAG: hypothetical protein INQ03_15800 [Candidatus Heimdallarchaeota archaeon]|nr:hypothetical protein [Candidatus Heimdallarchaeota archaeon]